MSQSKSSSTAKAKTKKATAKKKAAPVLETLRIIEAAGPPKSELPLTANEKALSDRTLALAAEIEKALKAGERDVVLDPAAVQALMAAACKVYSKHVDLGERYDAFAISAVTPTDVMVTASALLKAANLAVFELGMWQSWTGR